MSSELRSDNNYKYVNILAESVYRIEAICVVVVLLKSDHAEQINSSNIQYRKSTPYIVTKLPHEESIVRFEKYLHCV